MTRRRRLLILVNRNRPTGAGDLKRSRLLDASAQEKANTLARTGVLAHGQWWRTIYRHVRRSDWGRIAENIADGYSTADTVEKAWMTSTAHRANIVDPYLTHLGVGYAKAKSGTEYWVQHFGELR